MQGPGRCRGQSADRRLALSLAMRWRFVSRPAGERFQQCEHSGAVILLRTSRAQAEQGCGASGSGSPRRRRRQRAVRAVDESVMCTGDGVTHRSAGKGAAEHVTVWHTRRGAEAPCRGAWDGLTGRRVTPRGGHPSGGVTV